MKVRGVELDRERLKEIGDAPLDPLPTLKWKIGAAVFASTSSTVFVFWVAIRWLDVWPSVAGLLAMAVALVFVRLLVRGMTTPLRDMAEAARAMAKGDYGRRVETSSRDEVGELARAFNAMAAELAEVDRMRRDLVANVSHELRTPISALQVVLENLVDGVEPPAPDTLRTMLKQVERLGRLVRQLLDLSKLESGALPLQRCDFDLVTVLHDAAAEARLHAPDVEVHIDIHTDIPAALTTHGDPERIHQVVANLLENAVRHSPAGRPVTLTARRDDRADRRGVRGRRRGPRHRRRRCRAGVRAVLPGRRSPGLGQRRRRSRPGHRPLDRRPPRRDHPPRTQHPSRLPNGRGPARGEPGAGDHGSPRQKLTRAVRAGRRPSGTLGRTRMREQRVNMTNTGNTINVGRLGS